MQRVYRYENQRCGDVYGTPMVYTEYDEVTAWGTRGGSGFEIRPWTDFILEFPKHLRVSPPFQYIFTRVSPKIPRPLALPEYPWILSSPEKIQGPPASTDPLTTLMHYGRHYQFRPLGFMIYDHLSSPPAPAPASTADEPDEPDTMNESFG